MTQPQLTVVIIGGGIGGLFAANAGAATLNGFHVNSSLAITDGGEGAANIILCN